MTEGEDQADVERVLAGDVSGFEGIVRRWQGPLVNLAYRFCHDRGQAEEMAQEAFLRIYRGLSTWRREAVFSSWMFALAMNVYRSEMRRIPPATLGLHEIGEPKGAHSLEARVEELDRNQAVRRAVSLLPAKYREVLVLYYFHEMNLSAAAQSLGISEGTLKSRLFRAREILRGKLPRVMFTPQFKEAR